MSKILWKIDTASSVEDVENMCFDAKERGLFSQEDALRVLENGCGGAMRREDNKQAFGVSHIKANNAWIRAKLNIK